MEPNPVRKETRTPAVLPVRIYGLDSMGKAFNSVAHTLNVSKSGALLANVDVALNIGDLIGVQKGVYKGKFRVRWIGKKGTASQGQIGIECAEGPRNIWGVDERPHSLVRETAGAQRRSFVGGGFDRERRRATRYPCDLGIQIQQEGSEVKLWSRCTDISEGGCYVDSRSPLSSGAKFKLTMFTDPENLVVPVVVRTSFAGMGMGVEFLFESNDQQIALRRFLRQKFGDSSETVSAPKPIDLPALGKLSECVEQLTAWAAAAPLETEDREELEEYALTMRRELLGLRADLETRVQERSQATLVHKTSA